MIAFVAFLQALPAFIQSLPYLFRVALKVMNLLEKLILWTEKREFNAWLSECEKVIDQLDTAKTPEERRSAARGMVDIIRKLS
jgi:hypothetical protein